MRRTRVTELVGIDLPILQAPMANAATPEPVAAVSGAGALGAHGFGQADGAAVAEGLAALKAATNTPVHANVFCHPEPVLDPGLAKATVAAMAPAAEIAAPLGAQADAPVATP